MASDQKKKNIFGKYLSLEYFSTNIGSLDISGKISLADNYLASCLILGTGQVKVEALMGNNPFRAYDFPKRKD